MFQIFEDRRGDIWVSVQSRNPAWSGLSRFNRSDNRFHSLTESEGFPSGKSVSSFVEDNNGNLWLGFYEGGLARYDGSGFEVFSAEDGLPAELITDLELDRNGRLWLSSSGGGASRIDDPAAKKPSFVTFTTSNGLSSNNIRTITEDRFGNIYFGTVRGVDRISPETNRVKHYSVTDGLAGDFVVDSHCDKNGILWFATTSGLSRLVPTAEESYSPLPILLGGLRIAGVQRALPELGASELGPIELRDTQNNLQLDYFGLYFHTGETLRYQYILEGADADWSPPTEHRTITLANLSPGSYRFLVRALNSAGTTSPQPASVTFRILPPIWLRWWFIASVALLTVAILYSFYRYRTARLRELNAALAEAKRSEEALGRSRQERLVELERVRVRIATDLHDDIGSSLTQIALLSEVAHQQAGGDSNNGAASIARIIKVSNELVDTMSDIVWAINPRKDHLSDLLQRMRRFASDLLTARNITFQFRAPDTDRDLELGANLRREVFLIFKESINNIVKHSGCERAEISLRIEGDRLELNMSDDGKGFNVPSLNGGEPAFSAGKGGNGILSMRKRAEEMGGRFEIISAPGHGTAATLHMPIAQQASKDR
ncbi:MAG TPA: two-component regulator propeller domain-containing protein [Blastocatellia bacterium]|nr:two-component regulator propeller domain-containing protein [Blastocatellia bacterium]